MDVETRSAEEKKIKAGVADVILSFGHFEAALDIHISNIEDYGSEDGGGAGKAFGKIKPPVFSDELVEPESQLGTKLKRFVKLLKKIDTKRKFIKVLEGALSDFSHASEVRNCICHRHSLIRVLESHQAIELETAARFETKNGRKECSRFSMTADELQEVSKFVDRLAMHVFAVEVRIMYEYAIEGAMGSYCEPKMTYGDALWPKTHRKPPYPWTKQGIAWKSKPAKRLLDKGK